MSFDTLGLVDQVLSAVNECGYTEPTQVQEKTIPLILEGKDILGGAQTGTGKTASFVLPLLQHVIEKKRKGEKPTLGALILVPTRELAAQVLESINTYAKHLKLKTTAIFGGVNIRSQIIKLRRGVDILVATPGRLLDHVDQKTVNLSTIKHLVLDEADCMLDMGFIHDIKRILSVLPEKRQTLLFSATFSESVRSLSKDFLTDPEVVQVTQKNTISDQIEQVLYPVDKIRKQDLLLELIRENDWKQVLVFTRTKHVANKLTETLNKEGIRSTAIHGNKTQGARTKSLESFKKGHARVLVATDIAARGLNISQLPCVINFEFPLVATDYIHRIGRTARAGNQGEAISLLCVDELGLLNDVERLVKRSLPQEIIPGYEVDPSIKPEPIRRGRVASGSKNRRPQRSGSSRKPNRSKTERPISKPKSQKSNGPFTSAPAKKSADRTVKGRKPNSNGKVKAVSPWSGTARKLKKGKRSKGVNAVVFSKGKKSFSRKRK